MIPVQAAPLAVRVKCTHSLTRRLGPQRSSLPRFLIRGHLDNTTCVVSRPLTGEVVVESSDVPIKSIELQLIRVETCGKELCHVLLVSLECFNWNFFNIQYFVSSFFQFGDACCEMSSCPGCAEGYARDATEIQNIQIAEGDVCRGLPIPIYMVFPRLFTCPTLETTNFKVGQSAFSHFDMPSHFTAPPFSCDRARLAENTRF